jgi:DNA-directed RNA polymerase subunit RPC12/RpoP
MALVQCRGPGCEHLQLGPYCSTKCKNADDRPAVLSAKKHYSYKCGECSRQFSTLAGTRRHSTATHNKQKECEEGCDEDCDESVVRKGGNIIRLLLAAAATLAITTLTKT